MNSLDEKQKNKAALQKELGLPQRPEVPLIGFIGRLDWQKGPELIADAIHRLMDQDIQLARLYFVFILIYAFAFMFTFVYSFSGLPAPAARTREG